MKPVEFFWMISLGSLVALPARPASVLDVVPLDTAPSFATSPYETLLEAQAFASPAPLDTAADTFAIQVSLLLFAIVFLLNWAPPAHVAIRWARQTVAAAVARSRTRSTIARNPFDL